MPYWKYTPWEEPLDDSVAWKNGPAASLQFLNEVTGSVKVTFHLQGAAVPTVADFFSTVESVAVSVENKKDIELSIGAIWDWNCRMFGQEPTMRTDTNALWREVDLVIPGLGNLERGENPTDTAADYRPVGTIVPNVFLVFRLSTNANVVASSSSIRIVQQYYLFGKEGRKVAARRYIEERELKFEANGTFGDNRLPRTDIDNLFGIQLSLHKTDGTPEPINEMTFELEFNDGGKNTFRNLSGSDLAAMADLPFVGKPFTPANSAQGGDVVYLDFLKANEDHTKRSFKNAGLDPSTFRSFTCKGTTATGEAGYVRMVLDKFNRKNAAIIRPRAGN